MIDKIFKYFGFEKVKKDKNFSFDNYFKCNKLKKNIKLNGLILNKNKCFSVIMKPKHSRITFKVLVSDIKNDDGLINSFHPIETFILGIFLHIENNNLVDKMLFGEDIRFDINESFYPNLSPLVKIKKMSFYEKSPFVSINLFSLKTQKEKDVPALSFLNNLHLIFSLSPMDAFCVGYQVSDSFFRENAF